MQPDTPSFWRLVFDEIGRVTERVCITRAEFRHRLSHPGRDDARDVWLEIRWEPRGECGMGAERKHPMHETARNPTYMDRRMALAPEKRWPWREAEERQRRIEAAQSVGSSG